jgi:CO/xanthine dehydrogenase FAD-binding subunit
MDGDTIHQARVGLGGVGTIPWRARSAEDVLRDAPAGAEAFRAAAEAALEGAVAHSGTAFKVDLAKRTLVRTLETVSEEWS